jgi:hypothetical protein
VPKAREAPRPTRGHVEVAVAFPTNRDSYAFRDEQGEVLRAVVSALCAARWRTVDARSGMPPAVVRSTLERSEELAEAPREESE